MADLAATTIIVGGERVSAHVVFRSGGTYVAPLGSSLEDPSAWRRYDMASSAFLDDVDPADVRRQWNPGTALCSLKGCGLPLHLEVTSTFAIDDSPRPGDLRAAGDWWEVVCENGHKVANGGPDTDSRNARIGFRVGQILGGVR